MGRAAAAGLCLYLWFLSNIGLLSMYRRWWEEAIIEAVPWTILLLEHHRNIISAREWPSSSLSLWCNLLLGPVLLNIISIWKLDFFPLQENVFLDNFSTHCCHCFIVCLLRLQDSHLHEENVIIAEQQQCNDGQMERVIRVAQNWEFCQNLNSLQEFCSSREFIKVWELRFIWRWGSILMRE